MFRFGRMKVTKRQFAELTAQAEAGDVESQIKIANNYRLGLGVSEDNPKAIHWYKRAIEQGSVDALFDSKDYFIENLNYEAVEYYRQLAGKNNSEAQIILASLYSEGRCIPKNDTEAFCLRLRAAKLNNGEGCYLVGAALVSGDSIKKDIEEGIKWLVKIASPNSAISYFDIGSAQLSLSEAYADPGYSKRDLVEAYKWLNLLIANCSNEDFRDELDEKRDALASSMTREQIEDAQRRSADLFVPRKN